jgi:hypothetical protein
MALWTMTDDANGKPKHLSTADKAKTYGVDEAETTAKQGKVAHAGWVKITEGTGGRAGRVHYETLVAASSISGDAEDTKFQDLTILIGTQPVNRSVTAPAGTTFVVAASTTPLGGSLTFQWQVDTGGGYANVSNGATGGGGNYTGATTATLTIDDASGLNGYKYRVNISATGATTVTSVEATLTVA